MIDILIPTYNRYSNLQKNLRLLDAQFAMDSLFDKYRVLISDNCSPDDSFERLLALLPSLNLNCKVFRQSANCGLEKNSLFLLSESSADFFLYLGDDDYLPSGYLKYLYQKVNLTPGLACIIPGYSVLNTDGSVTSGRRSRPERQYPPGFITTLALSHYGHQLSGILCRRDGIFERYTANKDLRNLYPFIYFVAFNALRGTVIYSPFYSVTITVGNIKDWRYDNSGLLTDVAKNYKILYPRNVLNRGILELYFMYRQSWRIYDKNDFTRTWSAFKSIFLSEYVSSIARILLPVVYMLIWLDIHFLRSK
jgi:abequosyltransferase